MKLSLVDIIKEILSENVGPGPEDTVTMSQIYNDLYNQFHFHPETINNFEDGRGYVLYDEEEKLRMGKQTFNDKFGNDIDKYNNWKKLLNIPKGRSVRRVDMKF